MGKALQGMRKGVLIGFGLSGFALSGFLLSSNIDRGEAIQHLIKENSEINAKLEKVNEDFEKSILEYKTLKEYTLNLDKISKENESLNETLKSQLDEVKQENEKSKEVIKKLEKEKSEWVSYVQTHYTSYCSTGCTGKTASGVDVDKTIKHNGYHVIAVDPSRIPLGSIVEINDGEKVFKAQALDTGGAIKGNKIDLLVSVRDSSYAYSLGVKNVKIKVIRKGWA